MIQVRNLQVKDISESFAFETLGGDALGIFAVLIMIARQQNKAAFSFGLQQYAGIGHEGTWIILSACGRHVRVKVDPGTAERPCKNVGIGHTQHARDAGSPGEASNIDSLTVYLVLTAHVAGGVQGQANSIQRMT